MAEDMKFATLCSGIGAPEVAADRVGGFEHVFASEIEPFPCAVLAARWPDTPNYGDMTAWRDWPAHDLDLLIAGTPCQAFSVAGARAGLSDARGNLTLEFARYANHARPRFILWENVPGVLSDKSNAFGCLLAGLAGSDAPLLPRGGRWSNAGFVAGPRRQIAWRILDAQHFGVAQRRRRVWLLAGDLERGAGAWACARALFPEQGGVRGDSAQGGAAGEEVAGASGGRFAGGGWCDDLDRCGALITHTLRGDGFDASEDGTGRGTPLVVTPINTQVATRHKALGRGTGFGVGEPGDMQFTLGAAHSHAVHVYENHAQDSRVTVCGGIGPTVHAKFGTGGGNVPLVSAVSVHENQRAECTLNETSGALKCSGGKPGQGIPVAMVHWQQGGGEVEDGVSGALRANAEHSYQFARISSTVRRLTPRECERLQGFDDDHTAVQYRNNPAADGPRYKAIGNSMAVPCVAWILGNLKEVAT
jgi:DNA (cytosine-5)-methyltransferase 1